MTTSWRSGLGGLNRNTPDVMSGAGRFGDSQKAKIVEVMPAKKQEEKEMEARGERIDEVA